MDRSSDLPFTDMLCCVVIDVDSLDPELSELEQLITDRWTLRLLLVGTRGSGKTTLAKHAKIVYGSRLTPKALMVAGNTLHRDMIRAFQWLLKHRNRLFPSHASSSTDTA